MAKIEKEDPWTSIDRVRTSTKKELSKLKDELELSYNGVLVYLLENR